MVKRLVLGNKNFALSYDSNINIKDISFPTLGEENHLEENKNRLGFWVDGKFSWVDEEWEKDISYKKDSLVSNIRAKTDYLKIEIYENAAIYYKKNIYLKEIEVKNLSDKKREVRVFFHHKMKLYGKNKNNTALYDPITRSIIQYKKNRYFLFNGKVDDTYIYEYNIGTIPTGSEGNYRDAEDGRLELNNVAQGKVDSMISLREEIEAGESKKFYYWICAGKNFNEVRKLNAHVVSQSVPNLLNQTYMFWNNWVNKRDLNFDDLEEKLVSEYKNSLLLIKSHINDYGAIIGSIDYEHVQFNRDTYNYMWPREASITAIALDEAGYTEVTRNLFRFMKTIISEDGYFWHKYYPDGAMASTWHPWEENNNLVLPIQEDQTAFVLIAIYKHYIISKDFQFIEEIYKDLIEKIVLFLLHYIDENTNLPKVSYNIWENKSGVHLYTVGVVYEALYLSKYFVQMFGKVKLFKQMESTCEKIKKNIYNTFWDNEEKVFWPTVKINDQGKIKQEKIYDSSILFIPVLANFYKIFDNIDDTLEKTIKRLWVKTEIGGCSRYEGDTYHQLTRDIKKIPGNPWILTTLLVGNYYIIKDRLDEGLEIIKWVEKKAQKSGILSEQIHPYTGEQISVAPYTLSHAVYILTVNNLLRKKNINLI